MTVRVPAAPASAALIRQRISADLALSHIPAALVDDVVLVATELVSNAIRHAEPLPGSADTADGEVTITWEVDPTGVVVRVTDGGAASRPRVRHPSAREVSGRGLALVEALATRWGVEDSEEATTVWARLAVGTVGTAGTA